MHKREGKRDIEREGKIKRGREAQAEDAVLSRLAMHECISRTCHNQFDSMQTQTQTHIYRVYAFMYFPVRTRLL